MGILLDACVSVGIALETGLIWHIDGNEVVIASQE